MKSPIERLDEERVAVEPVEEVTVIEPVTVPIGAVSPNRGK
jgi:hypothetical protein